MSEETRGIGAALKAAREEKGWTTQDVGGRLRLMARQVEAIENENFSKLGPPVFARGFVRNYAKLLGLDPDVLLDQMTRIRTEPVQETEHVPFKPGQEFWKSPWVLGGIAAAILLILIPVVLYLWLGGNEQPVAPAVEQTVQPPPPPPAPQPELQPQPEQPATAEPQATTPVPAQPATAVPVAPAQPLPVQPAPAKPAAPAIQQPAPVAPAKTGGLRLQFDESSWVQIQDGSGRMVHSALNPAGSTVEVNGKPPFNLVVGNASHVQLSYKGQGIDLKPYTDINVARLTLN